MIFLIDANLSPRVAKILVDQGNQAVHVGDVGLLHAPDQEILDHAAEAGQVIVSADTDFATMLALAGLSVPSLVLLRSADRLTPEEQAALIVANLPTVVEDLGLGAVVSLSVQHLRVRRLPM